MRKIFYRDAVREALDEEMARDPMVMMIGEDIGVGDGTWKCSKGLREKYGDLRMKDSPISEAGFTGMCIGMALTGMRPISEIMFADFMLVAMDQIVNQMNKVCYMSGGQQQHSILRVYLHRSHISREQRLLFLQMPIQQKDY